MDICIIGTGYVGLVTGASLAYLGNTVHCVDIDAEKIEKLKVGESPIYEPGIDELIESGLKAGRLSFTTDLDEAMLSSEIVFIAVGTPQLADGSPDLSQVKAAAQGIGRAILVSRDYRRLRIIINKSTVPVGSGNWVEMLAREQIRSLIASSALATEEKGDENSRQVLASEEKSLPFVEEISAGVSVVSNPEFLREGTAIRDTFYPDRIVIGANDERALKVLERLYRPLLDQNFDPPESINPRPSSLESVPLVTTDLTSAEMIKYAANAFLAMKISFANEIANISEQTGADIMRVMEGIGLDSRIGNSFLSAGVGWGGSCFGKDISALIQIAREYSYRPELLEAVSAVNQRQRYLPVQKLQGALKIIKGRTIGLLGLAFKPNTDDVRDAPSFNIASELLKMGARVKVFDPIAMDSFRSQHPDLDLIYAQGVEYLAADCDALVVVTEWDEFRKLDLKALFALMPGSVLVDGRNIFDPKAAHEAGFNYIGVGR
ncbi:MAG: UDP-glucose/GDP-mannose dehydrogenase family protein [Blastocatellia bacterium]|nr:UDP-glucose/GDP-mannose dehydrogenase family protein [Blastocatellia bacterium]